MTAWCRRWLHKRRNVLPPPTKDTQGNSSTQSPVLTVAEINDAERSWIRQVQRDAYKTEVEMLSKGRCTSPKSTLSPLVPTLDGQDLLRVGGQLGKAPLSPDEAHPIILPPNSHPTQLYVVPSHRRTMHGGVQLTLGSIRQRFWIPKGRTIKGTIHRCVTCLR